MRGLPTRPATGSRAENGDAPRRITYLGGGPGRLADGGRNSERLISINSKRMKLDVTPGDVIHAIVQCYRIGRSVTLLVADRTPCRLSGPPNIALSLCHHPY